MNVNVTVFAVEVVVNAKRRWSTSSVTLTLLASYTPTPLPSPPLPFLSPFPSPLRHGMGVHFGSFDSICQTAALVICPLLGSDQGIEPTCYSRNVDFAGTLIFQPCEFSPPPKVASGPIKLSNGNLVLTILFSPHALATCFVHVVAIMMTGIMIYHIRSKYTAVGKWASFTVQGIVPCRPLLFLVRARSQGDCHVLLSLCDHRTHRNLS